MEVVIAAGFTLAGVIVTTVIAPRIIANQLAKTNAAIAEKASVQKRLDLAAQYLREDEVAARAELHAAALAEAQRALLAQTAEVAEGLKGQAKTINTIHGLTNSSYTAALQSDYDSVKRELASYAVNLLLLKRAGAEDTEEYAGIVAAQLESRARIAKLAAELAERAKQAALITSEIASSHGTDTDRIVDAIKAITPRRYGGPVLVANGHDPAAATPVVDLPTIGKVQIVQGPEDPPVRVEDKGKSET